jgi:hypothetical protein
MHEHPADVCDMPDLVNSDTESDCDSEASDDMPSLDDGDSAYGDDNAPCLTDDVAVVALQLNDSVHPGTTAPTTVHDNAAARLAHAQWWQATPTAIQNDISATIFRCFVNIRDVASTPPLTTSDEMDFLGFNVSAVNPTDTPELAISAPTTTTCAISAPYTTVTPVCATSAPTSLTICAPSAPTTSPAASTTVTPVCAISAPTSLTIGASSAPTAAPECEIPAPTAAPAATPACDVYNPHADLVYDSLKNGQMPTFGWKDIYPAALAARAATQAAALNTATPQSEPPSLNMATPLSEPPPPPSTPSVFRDDTGRPIAPLLSPLANMGATVDDFIVRTNVPVILNATFKILFEKSYLIKMPDTS